VSLKRNVLIGTFGLVGFVIASTVVMLLTTALSALIPVKKADTPAVLEKSLEQKLNEQSATKDQSQEKTKEDEKSESHNETPEQVKEQPTSSAAASEPVATPSYTPAPPPQPRFTTGPGNFDAPTYYAPVPQTGPGNM